MTKRNNHFYEFGLFRPDPVRRLLFGEDQVITLTPKVLHTLLVLVEKLRTGTFLPVKALSCVFRGKFVDGLRRAYRQKKFHFHGFHR